MFSVFLSLSIFLVSEFHSRASIQGKRVGFVTVHGPAGLSTGSSLLAPLGNASRAYHPWRGAVREERDLAATNWTGEKMWRERF